MYQSKQRLTYQTEDRLMPLYDVIVREVVGVTYTIEAKNKEEAENAYFEGHISHQEHWDAEIVRVELSTKLPKEMTDASSSRFMTW